MEFKQNDIVMVDHPDYPELCGPAKVIKVLNKIVSIEFCDDENKWMASLFASYDFLRHATQEEIRAASKS
ncbi:hypothetical protein FC702_06525 [Bacillus cereus]|nr:hypothetical protein [Bacillus cereus]TKJ07033.1 hypothetical protein FC702_06525 [Bacillus cereus]